MWILFSLLSGFGGALLAVLVKAYLKHLNIFFISFLFFAIASLTLLGIGLITKKIHYSLFESLNTQETTILCIAGIINAAAFTFYLLALSSGKTSGVVAIDRLGIIYVILLSLFIFNEPFTLKAAFGSLLMIGGAVLLSI